MATLIVGVLTLSIAAYLIIVEVAFVRKATAFDATIVEVRRESVHKGKGSVLAYVPIVEVPDVAHGAVKIKVDTFNEEPVYRIDQRMKVLCDSSSLKCVRNTFIDG